MAEQPSAAERAYATIRAGILDGTHPGGSMLSEVALAAEVGVSRTPVRAALARLCDEGWITVFPKRGALVRGMDQKAVRDLAGARLMLETGGVLHASTADRGALATRLRAELPHQAQALRDGDLSRFIELTVAFHRAFVEVSRNAVMVELGDRLGDRQRFLLRQHGPQLLERHVEVIAEHTALVDALAADDVERFAHLLRRHIADTHGSEVGPALAG